MRHSDKVVIKGLKVDAVIGVYDWERAITQPLVIDVTMKTDITEAADTDNIEHTINYKAVCDDITAWCQDTKAMLIERLAVLIADNILENYETDEVEISIGKPTAIKEADLVAVQIVRSRHGNQSK